VDIGLAPNWKGTLYGPPLAATLALEAAFCNRAPQAMPPPGALSLRRAGEANPNPNLKPTWLAIIAGRARPDEPEVVGGVQEEGW
jgi:hypothetical protein